jgi:hypothetical protein
MQSRNCPILLARSIGRWGRAMIPTVGEVIAMSAVGSVGSLD